MRTWAGNRIVVSICHGRGIVESLRARLTLAAATALLLVGLSSSACGEDERATEILVVTSEQGPPLELEELVLRVEVLRGASADLVRESRERARYEGGTLSPWSVTLSPQRASDVGTALYRFRVDGVREGAVYVTRQHRVAFVEGLRLTLNVRLSQACAGVACGPNETCGESVCIGDYIPPCTLAAAGQRCDDPMITDLDAGDMNVADAPALDVIDVGVEEIPPMAPDVADMATADAPELSDVVDLDVRDMAAVPDPLDMMVVAPLDMMVVDPLDMMVVDPLDMMVADPPDMMAADVRDMALPDSGPVGCTSAAECNDGNRCTSDSCVLSACTNVPMVCDDGNPCTTDACSPSSGLCTAANVADDTACGGGNRCCGGTCVSVSTTTRCGSCANACGSNQSCAAGSCTCTSGFGDCTAASGCETNLQTDEAHCGTCPTVCSGTMSCVGGTCRECATAADCNDSLSCTTDVCTAGGTCTNTVSTGCLIAGACVASATRNPANQCQLCTPASSTTAWSDVTNGTTCNDGLFCTMTDTCQAGACTGTGSPCPAAMSTCVPFCVEATDSCDATPTGPWCWIDGACVHETWDDAHPTNQCLGCEPNRDRYEWTWRSNTAGTMGEGCTDMMFCTATDTCQRGATIYDATCVGSGATCDDGLACTIDVCNEGSNRCQDPPSVTTGYCFIDGACYATGAVSPTNPCQTCSSGTRTAWTNRPQGYICGPYMECCNGTCGSCTDSSCNCEACVTGEFCNDPVGPGGCFCDF